MLTANMCGVLYGVVLCGVVRYKRAILASQSEHWDGAIKSFVHHKNVRCLVSDNAMGRG